ncbi:MAG TPA: peptide ABC transporter substrate-binding protein [Stellaceae bacterium]|nr:peptide ABC transporter substrate-binding protein [Stellaceae bacterium]
MRRPAFLLLAALGALLALANVALARSQLVIGVSQFPPSLNPLIDSTLAKSYVLGMARRPITAYDADWHLVCMLCVTLPSFENGLAERVPLANGREGVRLTYTLQPGATWGDGVPVSTEDVLFTYEVGKNPSTGVSSAEAFRRIIGIEAKDSKTFVVTQDRIDYEYQALSDFELLPAHLERAAFADPRSYRFRTRYDTEPTNPGLYFGPYKITELVPGARVVLERNPTWWGKRPDFDRVVVSTVENTAALEANLLAGSIDMISGEVGMISVDQALAFQRRHADRFSVLTRPGLFYEHVAVNFENPILGDLRVRQALLLGLDREGISKQMFGGKQPVADTIVHPLDWVHTDDVRHYPYDPEEARKLLTAAGWHPGSDGIRRNARGDRLSLDLATTSGNRTRELLEQIMQSQWRALGVEVHLRNQPARVLFGETVRKRAFDLALFGWVSAPENVPRSTLSSQEIPTAENGYTGQNSDGYRNAEMDRLIDAIEVTLDREKRADLWRRLQQVYADTLPDLPLFFRADSYVLPKWLKGVRPTGNLYTTTLWIEDWHDTGDQPR